MYTDGNGESFKKVEIFFTGCTQLRKQRGQQWLPTKEDKLVISLDSPGIIDDL
jgi:hypothetical protein